MFPSQTQALDQLLQNPLRFVPATSLTSEDEIKMAPVLRSRAIKRNESDGQRNHRLLTHHISPKWQRQALRPTPSRGLANPGNRCYQNTLFQSLLHIPKLVNWLEVDHENCAIENCLICKFKTFCERYWDDPLRQQPIANALDVFRARMATARGKLPHLYLESRSFVSAFVNVNWDWRIQQDSSEFYIKLLPAMLEGNASIEPTIRGLLGFHTSTAITCPSCNHVTSQTTTDYNLAIHINNGGPLTNILRHTTFAPNIIHGRHCDMCDHTGTVPQLTQLLTGPDVLVMDLLRFTNLFTKNMAQVSFGQDLDLTPFTTPKTELKYLLAATIHHKGNLNSGHFIAVAKCPNGRWQELNDPKVRNVRVEEALNPHGKWTPCTLIWTRVDGHGPAVTRI